jgi:hypothetical protein
VYCLLSKRDNFPTSNNAYKNIIKFEFSNKVEKAFKAYKFIA